MAQTSNINNYVIVGGSRYVEIKSFDDNKKTLDEVANFTSFKNYCKGWEDDEHAPLKGFYIRSFEDQIAVIEVNVITKLNQEQSSKVLLMNNDISVEISCSDAKVDTIVMVSKFIPFKDWFRNWPKDNKEISLKKVYIQGIDYFGPRIGFVKFTATVIHLPTGKPVPGIVFMRGGAVGILMILTCEDQEYVILTVQPRVPTSNMNFMEIPAGMLDGSGNFVGTAAKEVEEETGIKIKESELTCLTEKAYNGKYPGMYPSAGGCDEFISLFLYKKDISKGKFKELDGKLTGLRHEGELITLKLVPIDNVYIESPDAKALSALYLYQHLRMLNKL